MHVRTMPIVPLCELEINQEADFFALLVAKEEATTREGQPYFKVTFRDGGRQVTFPIWNNSPWIAACRDEWTPGQFFKLRAVYRETHYGPQLDIHKIRLVVESDRADGFDPAMCVARSRFNPQRMFEDLLTIVRQRIARPPLRTLVESILVKHREVLLAMPAAAHMHHAFIGGWLEHTLSVTRTCVYFAGKYAEHYPDLQPPVDQDLVIAGGVLHDIGKLRELNAKLEGIEYTPAGQMIGHVLQGRDMVREAAAASKLDEETLLRLEHIIVAHQRLPEWGAPKPPMTPEALLVHYADDVDAKFNIMQTILREDTRPGPLTSKKNHLGHSVFRGLEPER